MDPILVINCAADTDRRTQFIQTSKGANVTVINAIDARLGAGAFKPYLHLLRDHFWLGGDIKLGAFACFISHRLAWQHMVDNNISRAVIAEDDSQLMAGAINIPIEADLVFVNDRGVAWVPTGHIQDLLNPPQTCPRAIGGDGYILTLKGAKTLLKQSAIDGVICGVDWYLAYAGLNTQNLKHRDVKAVSEIKKLWKILGARPAMLTVSVAHHPLLQNNDAFGSSINHKEKINIKSFKQLIENA